jgi:uncharacterized protein (TIGR02268 family)
MSPLSPVVALVLAVLMTVPARAQPTAEDWQAVGVRRIELRAEASGEAHTVRIRPRLTTTLLFDTPLRRGGVELEGSERFKLVALDEAAQVLTLIPPFPSLPGERLKLTVRFADGAAPASATFWLEVHPAWAEQQVEVYRHPRPVESYQQEAREQREHAQRCEAELARARAERQGPGGFAGLIDAGWVVADRGLGALHVTKTTTQRPGEALTVRQAHSYRAQGQVAVALELSNADSQPWTAKGAELVGPRGERLRVLRVWQPGPVHPGDIERVIVEAEGREADTRGPFVLRLHEAGGARTVTLRGVSFP